MFTMKIILGRFQIILSKNRGFMVVNIEISK